MGRRPLHVRGKAFCRAFLVFCLHLRPATWRSTISASQKLRMSADALAKVSEGSVAAAVPEHPSDRPGRQQRQR